MRDMRKQRGSVQRAWREAKTQAGRMKSEVIKLNYYQSGGCNKTSRLLFSLKMTKLKGNETEAKRERARRAMMDEVKRQL